MSEVLTTAWSVARAGWRTSWNGSFRFSRTKGALIALALQAVFFLFVSRRSPVMAGAPTADSVGALLTLIAVQMGWLGLMEGFGRGQMQLYQGIMVPLFQITPARPLAFLIGKALEAMPTRVWSCLLWAWAFSAAVPGHARWAVMPVLAAAGMLVSTAAHLSGLLLLAFWSYWSPRTMRNGSGLFAVVTLALVTSAIIFLAKGGTVTQLSLIMRQYRGPALGLVLGLAGVPGLALLGALSVRPRIVEHLYCQGVYRVLELEETDVSRPGKSVWLPLHDGVIRAVLSREWLVLARSKLIVMQGLIWVAGTVGVYSAGNAMRGQPLTRQIAYVGALSMLTWFLAYGHLVMRAFEKERRAMLFYRLAGVPAPKLILAKLAALLGPSAVLVTVSALVGSLASRMGAGETLALLGWTLGALVAGTVGGFGIAAATAGQGEDQELIQGPPREGQAPQPTGNAWWTVARMISLLVTAALPVWTGAGRPGLPWQVAPAALLAVDAALPLALLAGGYWVMTRVWEANG